MTEAHDDGSPPCSPQIPTFKSGGLLGLGRFPSSQLTDAFLIEHLEWIFREHPILDVVQQELGESSRDIP